MTWDKVGSHEHGVHIRYLTLAGKSDHHTLPGLSQRPEIVLILAMLLMPDSAITDATVIVAKQSRSQGLPRALQHTSVIRLASVS